MPLKIIRQDITKINCDAIVSPSNRFLEPGGGADLAIHRAAGEELYKYCQQIGACEIGKALITPAFDLPARFVIHTAGPHWYKVENPVGILESCYRECMKLAIDNDCESVAFPLIGAGAYGCPGADVLRVATRVISEFLLENDMLVYIVVYDKNAFNISRKLFFDVETYIDDNYVSTHSEMRVVRGEEYVEYPSSTRKGFIARREETLCELNEKAIYIEHDEEIPDCSPISLDDMFAHMDLGFAETLFYYIDKQGISDVECYKRSNVDKRTFSKIKGNKGYKPSKITAISFAIGLKLSLDEATHLLRTAGFSLTNNNKFDVIIQYFLTTRKYEDIFEVNEVLYKYDQLMLGV